MDQQSAPRTHGLVLHWAARYDLLAWLLTHGRERELRETIARLASLTPGHDVLDIGCGTGTLAITATRHVGVTGAVTGIDASPSMIARANRKAKKAGVRTTFQVAVAEDLPFPDRRFDVVFSTLMLHHLPRKTRAGMCEGDREGSEGWRSGSSSRLRPHGAPRAIGPFSPARSCGYQGDGEPVRRCRPHGDAYGAGRHERSEFRGGGGVRC